ncbi:MAG: tRNA lysidine(34) synthetase TilS [Planctomycetota bacterium]|nr:MAG: tRNA lysidine(34) synthetase TilS [Planctomycetota bacterium]
MDQSPTRRATESCGTSPQSEAPLRWPSEAGPWLVGFSHGPDSTLLLALAVQHCQSADLPPPIAVHVDHALRPQSAAEAKAAQACAAELGAAFVCERIAPPASESRARQMRHQVFARALARLGGSCVLLGQHLDDQRETLLFRLLRGSGPLGLAGMRWRSVLQSPHRLLLVRPLLNWTRESILSELRRRRLPWIEDPSNANPEHTARNQIRHQLLPEWTQRQGGLAQLDALAAAAAALRSAVETELALAEPATPGPLRLPLELLDVLSPWTREQLYLRATRALGQPDPSRALLAECDALRRARSGSRSEARGRWRLRRTRSELQFEAWGQPS